jgi:voltage-gated potassium channel
MVLGSPIRNLLTVLAFLFRVCVAATLGYLAAGWSWLDATNMVTLTIHTVGYGEVRPIDTPHLYAV